MASHLTRCFLQHCPAGRMPTSAAMCPRLGLWERHPGTATCKTLGIEQSPQSFTGTTPPQPTQPSRRRTRSPASSRPTAKSTWTNSGPSRPTSSVWHCPLAMSCGANSTPRTGCTSSRPACCARHTNSRTTRAAWRSRWSPVRSPARCPRYPTSRGMRRSLLSSRRLCGSCRRRICGGSRRSSPRLPALSSDSF